jgi:hypothetical protein
MSCILAEKLRKVVWVWLALWLSVSWSMLSAATLPPGFVEAQFGANVGSAPTAMTFAPDGRLFVCRQGGQLRVIKNGTLLAAPLSR